MKHKKHNIVINWHLLENCQLKCKYCYAEWGKTDLPLIYRDNDKSQRLIKEISTLAELGRSVRLSFAGGEPLLDKNLDLKIDFAYKNNLTPSLITNGDLLSDKFIKNVSPKLSMLGVSIDSIDKQINLNIGRHTLGKRVPKYQEIIDYLNLARKINPNIEIKINTVVNQFNFDIDLSPVIKEIKPDKWKVLRVLPASERSIKQAITDEQFKVFKHKHHHICCASFEDNTDMENSYLMIDPHGRFFFNTSEKKYGYSDLILDIGIRKALEQIDFNSEKFIKRYKGEVK